MSDAVHRRYDRTTIAFHWIVAIAVLAQWLGAHTIDWFPKGPLRVDARSLHILVGTALAAAVVYRIYWRARHGVRIANDRALAWNALANGVHYLLMGLLVVVILLGLFNTWVRGDDIFGLFHLPKFGPYDADSRHQLANRVVDLHRLASNALLIVAGGHAAVGLFHHIVLKDDVLQRMLPTSSDVPAQKPYRE